MKSFIVLALCVAVAVAAPLDDSKNAQITKFSNNNIGIGEYGYGYETSDGKAAQESGKLKNPGTENEAIEVQGSFSYFGTDGVTYRVSYVANEFGFQPQGDHIPKAQ